jgi:hypothetical protein
MCRQNAQSLEVNKKIDDVFGSSGNDDFKGHMTKFMAELTTHCGYEPIKLPVVV